MVNSPEFIERSNVIWPKGTDKTKFDLRHKWNYGWIDLGSSFFSSDVTAAYLCGQLLDLANVTQKRRELWNYYHEKIAVFDHLILPIIPKGVSHSGHIYFA